MKTAFEKWNGESGVEAQGQFQVLILCEDATARSEAVLLYQHLTERIAVGSSLETFSRYAQNAHDRAVRIERLSSADMILVVGRDSAALPAELQNALDLGLDARRTETGALVALLGRTDITEKKPSSLHALLEQKAQRVGLEFFPSVFKLRASESVFSRHSRLSSISRN
ncbi:MAG: hypothetical protein ABIQ35_09375 [Verrucomicrobiota bacterium]